MALLIGVFLCYFRVAGIKALLLNEQILGCLISTLNTNYFMVMGKQLPEIVYFQMKMANRSVKGSVGSVLANIISTQIKYKALVNLENKSKPMPLTTKEVDNIALV